MANQGTTLTQSGQQVQALLNKIENLGPATQEQAGTLSAEDKAKLDGIETGADVSVNPDWNASSGKAQILNKPTIPTRLAQLNDDGQHRTVTDADKTNWNSKTSFSGNYNDLTNKPDLSQFITKSVDDLLYYYTKSESYTRTQIDNLINGIQTMHYEVYPILPETGSGNVLYLIGPIGTGADKYEEYVYYNNQWRKIGETSIDLSNYVTNDSLNTALASYVTSTSLATTLAGYVTDSELASALADVGSAFVAQYGTTTLSQIRTAALAGKAIFALRSTMVFVFSGINDDDKWVFTKAGASGSVAAVFVDEYDTWTDGFVSLQDSSKRTDTLSGNENDSTKYLSTKGAATELAKKYEKPSGGIPAADIASGVIPTVPTISTNITTDANSDTKTASPKAVKTYADTKYTKPSGGIPASDLADGVVPTTASATVNSNSGTPSVSVSMSNGNLAFAFSNLKGDQGNTGSSVAYPYELVNNCTTNDATKGLSAAQGKALKDELNQLDLEVSRLAGRFYGVFEDDSDLPDDATSVGYAFVGENEPFAIWNFNGTAWSDSGAEAVGLQGPQGNSGYTGAVGELEVVNNLVDGGATAALSAEAGKLLDRNIQLLYDSLGAAAFWGEKPVIDWSGNSVPVSLTLTNCTIDNIASSVPLGDSYEATVTPDAGNILASVVCTMNGEPQAVVNGVISIAEVTGAIVISAMGANLDTVVYDGKSYKQIFETNNALGINPGFDNGSYSPLVVNAGSPAVTSEEHDSGNYCLKASGTSSAQLKTSSTKSGAAFIACRVKVTSYTAGSCGCQFDLTAGVNRVTNGWETAYQNRTSSAAITAYVGSFSSANLTGYVDTPVVILKSTFSSVPTFDKFKELYDQYVAIKKAS